VKEWVRLAFAGASGTGKTTLAAYAAELLGLPVNPVGSRSVAAAMGFASPYDVDRAGRRAEFQRRLLAEKVAWEREHDAFVTDRTTLDNLAYLALHDVGSVDSEILAQASDGARRYTHVVYCQGVFPRAIEDPARVSDLAYHAVFDALLDGLILRYLAPWSQRVTRISGRDSRERERVLKVFLGLVDA